MSKLSLCVGEEHDKPAIFRLRHDVYAVELRQYEANVEQTLYDSPEVQSVYLTLWAEQELIGFVGITPPTSPRFSVDKHLRREEQAFAFDDSLHEIRALTVSREWRSFRIAGCLMYGAFRWVAANGGSRIISMGRKDVIDLYLRFGFRPVGQSYTCGAVDYDLLVARVPDMDKSIIRFQSQLDRMLCSVRWKLGIAFSSPIHTTGHTSVD